MKAGLDSMEEEVKTENQSVYNPETRNNLNTSLKDAVAIKFVEETEVFKKNRGDYFGMKETLADTDTKMTTLGRSLVEAGQFPLTMVAKGISRATSLDVGGVIKDVKDYKPSRLDAISVVKDFKGILYDNTDQERVKELTLNIDKQNSYVMEKVGLARTGQETFVDTLVEGGVSLGASIGLNAWVKGANIAYFGLSAMDRMVSRALNDGLDLEQADVAGFQAGAVEATLEKIGFTRYMRAVKGGKILDATFSEGLQEGAQELGGEFIAWVNGVSIPTVKEIWGNTVASFWAGTILGASTSGSFKAYNSIVKDVQDTGLSEEKSRKIVDFFIKKANKKEIKDEAIATLERQTSNLTFEGSDIDAGVEALRSKLDTNKQRFQEGQDIRDMVERDLEGADYAKELTPEAKADMTELLVNQAQMFAESGNLIGVSPREFYEANMATDVREGVMEGATFDEETGTMKDADGNDLFQLPDNAYGEEGQLKTESPEFKNWFGESEVIDAKGKPLVVYHGTRTEFESFDKDKQVEGAFGKGFYFTTNKKRAQLYSDDSKTMNVYLKADNVLDLFNITSEDIKRINESIKTDGLLDDYTPNSIHNRQVVINTLVANPDFAELTGYGAVKDKATRGETYLVFEPTQIKSVDNKGTFDPEDANIFRQGKGGIYNPVSRIITMLSDSNVTTPFHERLGHHTLEQMRVMNDLYIEKTGDNWGVWSDLENWVGKVAPSGLTTKQHEKFANGYIKFLKEGKAPTGRLKAVFIRMSELFKDIYTKALNNNVELNESARKLYKSILTSPYANSVEYYQQLGEDISKTADDIRAGKYKKASPEQLQELNDLIEQSEIKTPKEPQNFIQYVRERGGINLATAKLLDLHNLSAIKDTTGYSGLLRRNSPNNENDLTEMVAEFTGQDAYDMDSTDAVDFFAEALDEPVYRPEDLEVVKAIDDINMNRDIILDAIGENKVLKKELKTAKKLQDIGFTELASEKLVSKMAEIERLRKDKRLDTLTREQIKALQTEITDFVKSLPISKEGKSQFLTTIKNVNTAIQFRNAYKSILNRATEIYGREVRNETSDAIDKKIKQMSEKVVSGVRKGKYDYNTNKIFADLKKYNSMNKKQAFAEWEKTSKLGEGLDDIRTRFLTMKVLGKKDGSVELYKKVYDDLLELEKQGKSSTDLKDFMEKMQKITDIEKVKGIIQGVKPASKGAIAFDLSMGNFKSLLNSLGGQKLSKMNLIRSQKNEEVAVYKKTEELNSIARNAYDIEHNQVPFKMAENSHDNDYKLLYKDKTLGEVSLTRSNIISIYNLIKNPKIKEDYYNTFGELQVDSLVNELTAQDKAYGDGLTEFFEEYYPEMNEIYIELNGVDLGKPENYFPSSSEHQSYDDIFNDYVGQSNIPSSFKSKATGSVIPNPKIDSYGAVVKYIRQAERIKNVSRDQQKLLKIFKDVGIKNTITNLYGDKTYKNLIKKLNSYGLQGIAKEHDSITGFYNRLLANWTGAKVGLNPSVASKQLISILNASEGIDKKVFAKYLVEGMKTPKKTTKFMKEGSEYIGVREKRGGSDMMTRMIANAEQDINKLDRKLQKLGYNEITVKQFISWTQRKGDITPFIFGGYAKVKHLMSEDGGGLSKKEAFERMEDEFLESQQSGLSSMQSDLQNRGGFLKTLTQFKNTQHQYYVKMKNATQDYLRGEISKERLAEIYLIYGVVNPAIFGAIAYGFGSGLKHLGGDDDDDNILKEMGRAMATQIAGGVPLFGSIWEEAIRGMTKGYIFEDTTPVIGDIIGAMKGYGNNFDVDVAEVVEVLLEGGLGTPIQTPIRYGKKFGKIGKRITGN